MRTLLLCVTAVTIFVICGCGENPPSIVEADDLPSTTHASFIDGQSYGFTVTKGLLAESPDYDLGAEPPLSVAVAVSLAKQAAPAYFGSKKEYEEWRIETVSLCRLSDLPKWYYLIVFAPPVSRGFVAGQSQQLHIPVLFNRQIVTGKKRNFGAAQ